MIQMVRLGDVAHINPRFDKSSLADDVPVSFVQMASVGAADGEINVSIVRPFAEVKKGSYTPFKDGDVLFAKVTPCMENGKMAVARGLKNGVGFGSSEFHVLRPSDKVDAKYLYHFVSSQAFRKEAAGHMTGAVGLRRVPAAFLADKVIPLVPMDEQRRIVAEIEQQFSRLGVAVANLQRVKANLKRYKASVLKAAVEGRLAETKVKFDQSDDSSNLIPIGTVTESLDQGWSPQCENESRSSDQQWAVIKTTAVQHMQFLVDENKKLPSELTPREHLELVEGDLLITRAGPRSRVGVCCLVRSSAHRLMLCDKAYRLRAKLEAVLPAYLEVVLNSPTLLDSLDEMKSGISDSGLNLTQKRFLELCIPLPSLDVQTYIVTEVDRHLSIICELEADVDANIQRAQALRQTIRSKAFVIA